MARLFMLFVCIAMNQLRGIQCEDVCEGWKCTSNRTSTDCPVLCDNHPDCSGQEDEKHCSSYCNVGEVACKNTDYTRCVTAAHICNGKRDCKIGGEDENICPPGTCDDKEFKCSNGKCINPLIKCDGIEDCQDGSDETEDECEAIAVIISFLPAPNIAKNKKVKQSSTSNSKFANYAIDGKMDTCTETGAKVEWWRIELGGIFTITKVNIHGMSAHKDRLSHLDIEVRLVEYFSDARLIGDKRVSFCHRRGDEETDLIEAECPKNMPGNYVQIKHTQNKILSLCEVEIYGRRVQHFRIDKNIATGRPTKSTSKYVGGPPEKAVDGKMDDIFEDGSCFHSSDTPTDKEWWAVYLGGVFTVKTIAVLGRSDCCSERMGDIDIYVILLESGDEWDLEKGTASLCFYQKDPTTYIYANCPENTKGDYVRIRMRGKHILSFCEVFVYGTTNPRLQMEGKNLALKRPRIASSMYIANAYDDDLANDGKYAVTSGGGKCFASKQQNYPWWAVDLGARYRVDMVVIYGIDETNKDAFLKNFWINVLDSFCCDPGDLKDLSRSHSSSCHTQQADTVFLMAHCENSPEGQFVVIRRYDNYILILCEVEVYGTQTAPYDFERRKSFECDDLTCIPKDYECDGYLDCTDGLDEYKCGPCRDDQFTCNNDTGCINKFQQCDGIKDCFTGEDEADCHDCGVNYKCKDGSCVPANTVCQETSPCQNETINVNCWFECFEGLPIKHYKICDGIKDCSSGEDEHFCNYRDCGRGMRSCSKSNDTLSCHNETNSFCIPFYKICDMNQDCPLGEDELKCNTSFWSTTTESTTTTTTTTTEMTTTTTTIPTTAMNTTVTTTTLVNCLMSSAPSTSADITMVLLIVALALWASIRQIIR